MKMSFNFISIVQLYGYQLFDDIQIPKGIDKGLLINAIMDKSAIYEPLYTDETLLKNKIQTFFTKNYRTYQKLYDAYMLDYNPIENYDRKEDLSRTSTSNSNVDTKDNLTDNTLNKISPYDSETFKNDTSINNESTSTNKRQSNTDEDVKEVNRIHGNIGVTTTQQMLQSELDIVHKLNIYELIANDFYTEFMIKCM